MHVWKLQDCEYIAAETLDQAVNWYRGMFGEDPDPELIEEIPLTDKVNAAEEGELVQLITFAEAVIELQGKGEKLPMIVGFDSHYA